MIQIRPIRPDEVTAARRLILRVAYNIYGWSGTLEESIRHFEESGQFKDMDDVRLHYFDNHGLFLVAYDDQKLIGTGAIRKLDSQFSELKRLWLLESYYGKGIGYNLLTDLFGFARTQGYTGVRLQTSPEQTRALAFYRKVGFYEIPCYNDDVSEISMEIKI